MADQVGRPGLGNSWPRLRTILPLLAGIAALVPFFPIRGIDTDPPICYSAVGLTVACGAELSIGVGLATAAAVGVAVWVAQSRRRSLFGVAAALLGAFTVLWVMPAMAGPSVDCGPFDESACERHVAEVIATHDAATTPVDHRRPFFLPVLSVKLSGSEVSLDYEISWLGGGFSVITD
jgi:hypothetical protein